LGAKVTVFEKNWNAADELARERAEKDENAEYVSPYDNFLL
jgi:threonine dehydratase